MLRLTNIETRPGLLIGVRSLGVGVRSQRAHHQPDAKLKSIPTLCVLCASAVNPVRPRRSPSGFINAEANERLGDGQFRAQPAALAEADHLRGHEGSESSKKA
jgi:hypothetical protein